MKRFLAVILAVSAVFAAGAVSWRTALSSELKTVIPAKAPVEKERIETEERTASGVTDGNGKFIAGVVLITAGYSADGKYSHFFVTQVPLKLGNGVTLQPGEYLLGSHKEEDALAITFYTATDGKQIGTTKAARLTKLGKIESFHVSAPGDRPGTIMIGRFGFPYEIEQ